MKTKTDKRKFNKFNSFFKYQSSKMCKYWAEVKGEYEQAEICRRNNQLYPMCEDCPHFSPEN